MRKKKVLVYGTLDNLNKFFADAVSRDYEVVAILSDDPEKISTGLEVFTPQNLPKSLFNVVDAVIIAADKKSIFEIFITANFPPRKTILWSAEDGWEQFEFQEADGSRTVLIDGLEFHVRDADDEKFLKQTVSRLKANRKFKNMNPNLYESILNKTFQRRRGYELDFKNPKTFTEKLQWIKIHDATPLKSRLADKYAVRAWVADKIGAEYLIPLFGVWEDFDDINFDDLPNQFVLKCNHGYAFNIIVRDKKTIDKEKAREKINAWLAQDFGYLKNLELHYSRIERKIIAEKFMQNGDLPDLIDYKFVCLSGKIIYCQYLTDRSSNLKLNYFDMNWKITDVERSDHPRSDNPEKIPPPKNFELMKKLAATLAEGFPFVRVDFYEIEGKVYFGEMTFTPGAGNFSYKSAGTDEYLGSLLKLPNKYPPTITTATSL